MSEWNVLGVGNVAFIYLEPFTPIYNWKKNVQLLSFFFFGKKAKLIFARVSSQQLVAGESHINGVLSILKAIVTQEIKAYRLMLSDSNFSDLFSLSVHLMFVLWEADSAKKLCGNQVSKKANVNEFRQQFHNNFHKFLDHVQFTVKYFRSL